MKKWNILEQKACATHKSEKVRKAAFRSIECNWSKYLKWTDFLSKKAPAFTRALRKIKI